MFSFLHWGVASRVAQVRWGSGVKQMSGSIWFYMYYMMPYICVYKYTEIISFWKWVCTIWCMTSWCCLFCLTHLAPILPVSHTYPLPSQSWGLRVKYACYWFNACLFLRIQLLFPSSLPNRRGNGRRAGQRSWAWGLKVALGVTEEVLEMGTRLQENHVVDVVCWTWYSLGNRTSKGSNMCFVPLAFYTIGSNFIFEA